MEEVVAEANSTPELNDEQKRIEQILNISAAPLVLATAMSIGANGRSNESELDFAVNTFIVVFVSFLLYNRRATDWLGAAIAVGVIGAFASGFSVIVDLFIDFHVADIFRLFTESAFTGMLDAVAAGFLFQLFAIIDNAISNK